MKITKYQHACLSIEKDGQLLVIDPGNLSSDFIAPEHVIAIVITHEHSDHFDHDQIAAIIDKNPEAIVIGPKAVVANIEVFQTKIVHAGDIVSAGVFTLEFFGGEHALIHPSIPLIANLGILVNDLFYYPGDSFTLPGRPIDTLAIPASAPWMKIGEAMDFLVDTLPRLAFPTHDAILSPEGKKITDTMLGMTAKKNTIEYRRLDNPIDI